jgi:hypothetical protein
VWWPSAFYLWKLSPFKLILFEHMTKMSSTTANSHSDKVSGRELYYLPTNEPYSLCLYNCETVRCLEQQSEDEDNQINSSPICRSKASKGLNLLNLNKNQNEWKPKVSIFKGSNSTSSTETNSAEKIKSWGHNILQHSIPVISRDESISCEVLMKNQADSNNATVSNSLLECISTSESEVYCVNSFGDHGLLKRVNDDIEKKQVSSKSQIKPVSWRKKEVNVMVDDDRRSSPFLSESRNIDKLYVFYAEQETEKVMTLRKRSLTFNCNHKFNTSEGSNIFDRPSRSVSTRMTALPRDSLSRASAVYLYNNNSLEYPSSKIRSKGILSGILDSIPDKPRSESVFSRIRPTFKGTASYVVHEDPSSDITERLTSMSAEKSFYWDRLLRLATERRRFQKKQKKKWRRQTTELILWKMHNVAKVMDKKSYYNVVHFNNGRTEPWKEILLSLG